MNWKKLLEAHEKSSSVHSLYIRLAFSKICQRNKVISPPISGNTRHSSLGKNLQLKVSSIPPTALGLKGVMNSCIMKMCIRRDCFSIKVLEILSGWHLKMFLSHFGKCGHSLFLYMRCFIKTYLKLKSWVFYIPGLTIASGGRS